MSTSVGASGGVLLAPVPDVRGAGTALARGGALLMGARVVMALTGTLTLALAARTLSPAGLGDLLAALAAVGLASGVLAAALSDAAVVSGSGARDLRPVHLLAAAGAAGAVALGLLAGAGPGVGALAAVAFLHASVGTAPRTAAARRAGQAGRLAAVQVAGSTATLAVATGAALAGVRSAGLLLAGYALQPVATWLLPRATPGPAAREVPPTAVPYVLAQVGWVVVSQAGVLLLRVVQGPEAAGRYGAAVRLLDVLAVLGPLLATLVLPVLVRLEAAGGRSRSAALNLLVAAAGTSVLVVGLPLGWIGWRLLYDDLPFPSLLFGLVGLAYGLGAATGLPDRVLQARGAASRVAAGALATAAVVLALGTPAAFLGPVAVAGVVLVALGLVNAVLLLSVPLPRRVLAAHGLLAVGAAAAALVVATGHTSGAPAVSAASSLVLLLVVGHAAVLVRPVVAGSAAR